MLQTVDLWGVDSFRMALRNHEIDNHLSMTLVNQKDKSSVSLSVGCYSAGDRHSPRMQTPSPICQRHNNVAGRPHLHHLAHNKCNWRKYWLLYHGKEGCPSWPFSGKSNSFHLSSYTFWRKNISEVTIDKMYNVKYSGVNTWCCYSSFILSHSPKPTRKSVTNK